jgi:DNA-binding MarR family transcriptional regulator
MLCLVSEFLTLFTRASKAMRTVADAAYTRHGVRVGQNLLLEVLWETDGLTPGEVAKRLHVTTPTVVKMASRMAAAGLVTSERDTRDRRLARLHLTGQGRSVKDAIEAEQKQLEKHATAGLSAAQRRNLHEALEIMARNLEDIPPPDSGRPA